MPRAKIATAGRLLLAAILLWAGASAHAQHINDTSFDFGPATFKASNLVEPLRGPDKAKGLVIWNHGRGDRTAAYEAPPLAQLFHWNGWDVYSMYRGWGVDARNTALQLVITAVERGRKLGYQRIILMGQSAGAYASVESVAYVDNIDAVIALAPAAHGDSGKSTTWRQNDFMMRGMWEKFARQKTKAVAAYFTGDIFYESELPNIRGPWLEKRMGELGIPHMVISQPSVGDLDGHLAGHSWNFVRRYGHCILKFVETGMSPPCGEEPAAVATFGITPPVGYSRQQDDPFAGRWFGTWTNARLTVFGFPAAGSTQKGIYRSGIGDGVDKPENLEFTVTRKPDALSWRLGRYIYEVRPTASGELAASRHNPDKPNEKSTALLKRLD